MKNVGFALFFLGDGKTVLRKSVVCFWKKEVFWMAIFGEKRRRKSLFAQFYTLYTADLFFDSQTFFVWEF